MKTLTVGYSETSEDLNSTTNSNFSKTPNSTKRSSQSSFPSRKERNGKRRIFKGKSSLIEESTETSEKILSENDLNVESVKSTDQRINPSDDTQRTSRKKKNIHPYTPSKVQGSLEVK